MGLSGPGAEGRGEEIGPLIEDHDALAAAGRGLPLARGWTIASFSEQLAGVELWPSPPRWAMARRWRTWAFESAALDLALRQAGIGRPEALGYIAAPGGDFGWAAPDDELHRFHNAQTPELGAHLCGRRLYETMV